MAAPRHGAANEIGRTILRTSLLALMLLASCFALLAPAQPQANHPGAGAAAVGVPRLVAQVEDRSVPIELETLDAEVRIHGFLAETTLVMTFFNRAPWLLEGEFLLTLPPGATVCGYGLDVDGVLVDGVVVEKQKARIAFEREARRQIDPGIVEWVGGGLFRTRVYPIEGESRRTIKIQYVAQLDFDRHRQAVYRLPLAAYPKLAKLRLRVEVVGPELEPRIERHPFSRMPRLLGDRGEYLQPRREGDVFVAEGAADDLKAKEDLEIRLESRRQQMVVVEEMGDGTTAFAAVDFADRRGPAGRRTPPERLALFWDGSFSRHRADHHKARKVVAALLRKWRPREVVLMVFRDRAEAPVTFAVEGGRSAELLSALDEVVYDGATGWRDLELPAGFDAGAALLFSDGRINFGDRDLPALGVPVYAVSSARDGDAQVLRHLAESSGGAYFDLTAMTRRSIVRELARVPVALRRVAVVDGEVTEILAPVGRPVRGATVVTGFLASDEARLELVYAAGEVDRQRVAIPLRAAPGGALAERFWAQEKLARLALFPQEHRQEILALGREHGLVTPETSLIVLETLDQYLEYEIEPPASLPEMRQDYLELVEEERADAREDLEDYLQLLRRDWEEFLAGSQESYDFPPPGTWEPEEPQPAAEPSLEPSEPSPASAEPSPASAEPPAGVEEMVVVTSEMAAAEPAGEGSGEIVLKPWAPDAPYLEALRAAPAGDLYEAYLEQRDAYAASPAFYVDVARLFFDRGMGREGLLIASNLLELGVEEPRLIRAAASLFLLAKAWDRAVMLFERLVRLRPEMPQSNRDLAVALILRGEAREEANPAAARRDYRRAVSLLYRVALEPWGEVPSPLQIAYLDEGRFEEIGRIALVELGWALGKLKSSPEEAVDDLPEVDPSWIHLPVADLRIVLTWDDEFADMDLWVVEPSGEKVYYGNPRSAIGGLLSEDCTTGLGPEAYFLKRAMPGTYRILVDFYSDSGPELLGPVTVQTLIATGLGTEDERLELQSVRLETQEDTVEIGSVTVGE